VSWPLVTLGDVSKISGQYGVGLSSREWSDGDPRYIRITDINDDGRLNASVVAPDGDHSDWDKAILQPGDLLFARSGATVGKTYLHGADAPLAVYAGYLIRFQLDTDRVLPEYAFRFTQSPDYRTWVASSQRAVAQPNINAKQYATLPIPLPPLDEQRRIAAILDQADELATRRDMTIGLIGNLRQSLFIDMFGVADQVAKTWECAPLSDLADTCSGGTPSRSDNSYYGGDIPWVKSGEVAQGLVLSTEETITETAVANSSAKVMPPGTVLVAMYGATAGKVGILGISAATNQAVCSITPGALLKVGYLVEVLRSMNDHLLAQRSGGAQPNLSQGVIRGLQIPVPPVESKSSFAVGLLKLTLPKHKQSQRWPGIPACSSPSKPAPSPVSYDEVSGCLILRS
jgi:type I restriction enzyme S subunit